MPKPWSPYCENSHSCCRDPTFAPPFALHGVRVLDGGKVVLRARDDDDEQAIRRTREGWAACLGSRVEVSDPTYPVVG